MFTLSKLDSKYLEITGQEKRLLNARSEENFEPNLYNQENIFISRDSNLNGHITTPSFLKHSFVLISVIVVSFLVLIFLVALVIVMFKKFVLLMFKKFLLKIFFQLRLLS